MKITSPVIDPKSTSKKVKSKIFLNKLEACLLKKNIKYLDLINKVFLTKYCSSKSKTKEEEYVKMVLSYMTLDKSKKEFRKQWMDQFKLSVTINGVDFKVTDIHPKTYKVSIINHLQSRNRLTTTKVDLLDVLGSMKEII